MLAKEIDNGLAGQLDLLRYDDMVRTKQSRVFRHISNVKKLPCLTLRPIQTKDFHIT